MQFWKVRVLPNPGALEPCHTVVVRATTRDDAVFLALEDARKNEVVHDAPCVKECCIATVEESRLLEDNDTIALLEYKSPHGETDQ